MSDTAAVRLFARDIPRYLESDTGRPPRYPRSRSSRWLLRLSVIAVFCAFALWFNAASGGDWSATANAELIARASALREAEVSSVVLSYPPLTMLISMLLPANGLWFALAGAVVTGCLVPYVVQAVARKGYGSVTVIALTVALLATPMWAFIALTDLGTTLGVVFFGLGMIDLVRFVTYANTQAGFRAGLWFGAAAFSDATTTLSALVAATAAALLVQSRHKARAANAMVVLFPSVSVLGSLLLLSFIFRSRSLELFGGGRLGWDAARFDALVAFLQSPAGLIHLAPLALVIFASIALRFPSTALIAVVLVGGTYVSYVFGLTNANSAGTGYLLLLLVALAIIPERQSSASTVSALLFGGGLWALGWMIAFTRAPVVAWLQTWGVQL